MVDPKRQSYLGSHDVAAIAGVHPFRNAMDVFVEKIGIDVPVTGTKSQQFEWGKRQQPLILQKYREEHNVDLIEEPFFRHPKIEFLGATPDAVVKNHPIIVEAKNIRYKDDEEWGPEKSNDVPAYIFFQAQHHLLCAQKDYLRVEVCALFSGCQYTEYVIWKDNEFQERIIEVATEFWTRHIVRNVPPTVELGDALKEYLRQKFPKEKHPVREAQPNEEPVFDKLVMLMDEKRMLEEEMERLKAEAKLLIGDHSGVRWRNGRIVWKKVRDTTKVDWEKVARELDPPEDLIQKHTKIRLGARRFNVYPKGKMPKTRLDLTSRKALSEVPWAIQVSGRDPYRKRLEFQKEGFQWQKQVNGRGQALTMTGLTEVRAKKWAEWALGECPHAYVYLINRKTGEVLRYKE